jgi:triosephosphate isomerase (TIM)
MNRILAANWKMNLSLAEARALYAEIADARPIVPRITTLVFPPFTAIATLAEMARARGGPALGGQNCHPEARGAFTGEISAEQVRDAGAEFLLVGHSERRRLFCESDQLTRSKLAAAWRAGLVPLLCVGETLAERERQETRPVLARQLQRALESAPARAPLYVAYEPVWAIGTGVVAAPEQVAEAHAWVREELNGLGRKESVAPILYGGSVDPRNAASLAAIAEVDGFLVGGASLTAPSFLAIAAALDAAAAQAGARVH